MDQILGEDLTFHRVLIFHFLISVKCLSFQSSQQRCLSFQFSLKQPGKCTISSDAGKLILCSEMLLLTLSTQLPQSLGLPGPSGLVPRSGG